MKLELAIRLELWNERRGSAVELKSLSVCCAPSVLVASLLLTPVVVAAVLVVLSMRQPLPLVLLPFTIGMPSLWARVVVRRLPHVRGHGASPLLMVVVVLRVVGLLRVGSVARVHHVVVRAAHASGLVGALGKLARAGTRHFVRT